MSSAFILGAMLFGGMAIFQLNRSHPDLSMAIAKFIQADDQDKAKLDDYLKVEKEKSKNLVRTNFFSPILPRPPILMSVMGEEAMINDRWYKVGDKVEEEVIKSIHAEYVELEKDSKTRQLKISGY